MGLTARINGLFRSFRRWKGSVKHQVTWSGLAFTAIIVMVGLGAFASGNNLLFLLLAALLSTMLISGFVSRLSLSGLDVRLLHPEHVFAKRKLPARIELTNTKGYMPSYSIHLASSDEEESPLRIYFPIIPGGATAEAHTTVFFRTRGLHGDSQYQFTTRFPFGFTERRLQVRLHREVLVYPSIEPQPGFEELLLSLEGDIDAHYRGRGNDFYRIRPYEHGESARHVDWKATAHTSELQVREFAREQDHMVEIFLDRDVPAMEQAWFEHAIDCCAFLCWRLATSGVRLRFVSQSVDIRLPDQGDIYSVLKFLAEAQITRTKATAFPQEANSFQIVFSLSQESAVDNTWQDARRLGRSMVLS